MVVAGVTTQIEPATAGKGTYQDYAAREDDCPDNSHSLAESRPLTFRKW